MRWCVPGNLGVQTAVVTKAELNDAEVMLPLLRQYGIQFIVLAGFLPLVPDFLIDALSASHCQPPPGIAAEVWWQRGCGDTMYTRL